MESAAGEVTFDCSYGQEAQRWLSTVYAAMEKMPAGKLFALLKPSITVHLVKQAKFFIEEAFQGQDQSQVFSAGHSTGSKAVDAQRFYNAQCAVYIYYRVLQGLLASATGKHTRSGAIADARVASLASNQTLQLALLTCAVELTHYCTTGAATFPDVTSKLGQHTAGLDIWEAAEHFLHYLAAESTIPMADSVSNYLLFMRMKVVESLAWQTGSSLYQAICEGGGGSCCPGDYALVYSFLDGVNALAKTRVSAVAARVAAVGAGLSKSPAFGDDCVWLMEAVLQEHLDLLFDQHLSNMVACCVYATARAHGVALSFKKITDTIMQTFPHHDTQDFNHADLGAESATGETRSGDTRQLYNEIFLPRMEASLQEKFPSTYQHDAVASEVSSKQALGFKRAPLKSLSATDMNTRLTRFGKMQS